LMPRHWQGFIVFLILHRFSCALLQIIIIISFMNVSSLKQTQVKHLNTRSI